MSNRNKFNAYFTADGLRVIPMDVDGGVDEVPIPVAPDGTLWYHWFHDNNYTIPYSIVETLKHIYGSWQEVRQNTVGSHLKDYPFLQLQKRPIENQTQQ